MLIRMGSAVVDMETEFKNNYFVLFFFPMDFKVDSTKILSFNEHLEEFCDIVGVTSDSPLSSQSVDEQGCLG